MYCVCMFTSSDGRNKNAGLKLHCGKCKIFGVCRRVLLLQPSLVE